MKFTFKTTKPTGRYASFDSDMHEIKLNKISVGLITDRKWKIRLKVYKVEGEPDLENNPNCDWRWITLTVKSQSLQEAKDFLNKNIQKIIEKWKLVCE